MSGIAETFPGHASGVSGRSATGQLLFDNNTGRSSGHRRMHPRAFPAGSRDKHALVAPRYPYPSQDLR
jgi:hypothetical protein